MEKFTVKEDKKLNLILVIQITLGVITTISTILGIVVNYKALFFKDPPTPPSVLHQIANEAVKSSTDIQTNSDIEKFDKSDPKNTPGLSFDTKGKRNETSAIVNNFAHLSDLLQSVTKDSDLPKLEALINGVGKISQPELAAATLEQVHIYEKAKTTGIKLAWDLLQAKLGALGETPDATAFKSIAAISRVLKENISVSLTSEQKELLEKGMEIEKQVAESDMRLKNLRLAATNWETRGVSAGQAVLTPLNAITPFDQSRFGSEDKKAQVSLLQAKDVFEIRDKGLSLETQKYLKIFIQPEGNDEKVNLVVRELSKELTTEGFQIGTGISDSALRVRVAIESIVKMPEDPNSGRLENYYRAYLHVTAIWVDDNSEVLSGKILGEGKCSTESQTSASDLALLNAIHLTVERFKSIVGK